MRTIREIFFPSLFHLSPFIVFVFFPLLMLLLLLLILRLVRSLSLLLPPDPPLPAGHLPSLSLLPFLSCALPTSPTRTHKRQQTHD